MVRFLNVKTENADVEEIMDNINNAILLESDDNFSSNIDYYNIKLSLERLRENLNLTNQTYRIEPNFNVKSSPGFKGRVKELTKRIVRKLVIWCFLQNDEQQTVFNAAITRCQNEQTLLVKYLLERNNIVEKELKKVVTEMHKQMDSGIEEEWYTEFENHFRGEEKEIKARLERYLPYFKDKKNVLEIGCGRGEFLEILKENNISGYGVDVNPYMIDICLKKGLAVQKKDGILALRAIKDETIDGIFASQVIEHLKFNDLKLMLELAYRKLKKDGVLILETVNPLTLGVFCYGFYIDPTHKQPIHPAMLRFMLEKQGFQVDPVEFASQFPKEYKFEVDKLEDGYVKNNFIKLNKLIYGAQDYFIVCHKVV